MQISYVFAASLWGVILCQSMCVQAVTLRYAIVIGNNIGVDVDGEQPFPPLKHAEKEARRLKDKLIGTANFDASNDRTILLNGATRADVKSAFAKLADQKKADRALFGSLDSIFLFYYTGHGLKGRLLLQDGPLASTEIVDLFKSINADLSVGIFDACYAGSLDGLLEEKGIRVTPGLNMFENLPQEVLSVKGNIWYVSSGAGEPSYEDKELGGIFTHYFIEALTSADKEGPGITLDSIWKYVRKKTKAYAASNHRRQAPEQLISRLHATAPVYFSFPISRSAELVLSEAFSGRFALTYADGNLVEIIEKRAGNKKILRVYPGDARLLVLDNPPLNQANYEISLKKGRAVVLQTPEEAVPYSTVGYRSNVLVVKGGGNKDQFKATVIEPGTTVMGGIGYGATFAGKEMLHPRHRISASLRLDRRLFNVAVRLFYGVERRHPDEWEWQYAAHLMGGEIQSGYGWRIKRFHPSLGFGVSAARIWQFFKGVKKPKSCFELHLQGKISVLFSIHEKLLLLLSGEFGPLYSPGAAVDKENVWHPAGGISLVGYFRFV